MQKISILYDAIQAVLSTFDLDQVLEQMLAIVRDYFHVENSAILLWDPAQEKFLVRRAIGRKHGTDITLAPGQGIIGTAARLKRPLYAPDVSKDPRYIRTYSETRSEVAIPLILDDEVVGVLDCQSHRLDFFDRETIDLLTLFSTQASIALQNARLYSQEHRTAGQLRAINAVARQTTAMLDLNNLLPKVCSQILEAFAVDHVGVMLLEERRLVMKAHEGRLTALIEPGWELPFGAGICARALATRQAVVVNDVSQHPQYVPGFQETKSETCIPLVSMGTPLGVLVLDSATLNAFPQGDVEALESVADMCAVAIQNAQSFERVREMADMDGLTGVYNRRHLEKRIVSEVEHHSRHTQSMAVLMVDLDHFKRINDEFGHLLGDEVLRQVSRIFIQQLRKGDVVCRYGGEEFAILLRQSTAEQSLRVAEKLRTIIRDFNFPGIPRPVTISVGVAIYPLHGRNRDELIGAADAALYNAKQTGRNRVVSADKVQEVPR